MPHATLLFASLLTLLYLYLVWQVIRLRHAHQVDFGDAGHPDLHRAIRAHANFQEYAPLFLILLGLEDKVSHAAWWCYLIGGLFLLGRLSHAYGLLVAEPRGHASGASINHIFRFRGLGMLCTLLPLAILAILLLMHYSARMFLV